MNSPAALVLSPKRPPHELALFPPGTTLHEGRLSSGLLVRWYERGDADKPAVLFIHGFPELAVSWTHQFAELSDSYRLIAMDTRGCGGTEAPWMFWSYRLRRAAQDCVELLAAIGVERAHLVGHDMGTAIAWEAAQSFASSFRSLSIVNGPCLPLMFRNAHKQAAPSSYIWNMFVPFWFSTYAKRDPERMLKDAFHRDADHERVFTPEVIEAYAKHIRRIGVPAVNYYRAFAVFPTFRLKPVHMPVRLVWGENDPWVGSFFSEPKTYEKFVDDIDAVVIRDKGHFVQQQAPGPVNQALREHFQRVDSRSV